MELQRVGHDLVTEKQQVYRLFQYGFNLLHCIYVYQPKETGATSSAGWDCLWTRDFVSYLGLHLPRVIILKPLRSNTELFENDIIDWITAPHASWTSCITILHPHTYHVIFQCLLLEEAEDISLHPNLWCTWPCNLVWSMRCGPKWQVCQLQAKISRGILCFSLLSWTPVTLREKIMSQVATGPRRMRKYVA